MRNKCLYCHQLIIDSEQIDKIEYHTKCCKKFFGQKTPPEINFTQNQMYQLAEKIVKSQKSVTGVQIKLSLGIERISKTSLAQKLTIVGLWGKYILKPQTKQYKQLPENEDITMHLADVSKINTVPHCLIRLKSGELAYITKRVDRKNEIKVHMEDMCQLTNRLTEHKYRGSHEQIAKIIIKHCQNSGLDLINYYELVLFCFLTGNNDMHLKNFSLLKNVELKYNLCPAYDLVASELLVIGDDEELALNLNGRKRNLRKKDFIQAMKTSGINDKAIENVFIKFSKLKDLWFVTIDNSFLNKQVQEEYKLMIVCKFKQLDL